jgi:hypothetical protein
MVTAFPLPTLTTSEGETEQLSPKALRFLRAFQAVEHILDESDVGSVTIHFGKEELTVIPAPQFKLKAA